MTQLVAIPLEYLEKLEKRLEQIEAKLPDAQREEWLSKSDYAKKVGKSISTVNRRISEGRLEIKDVCGSVWIRLDV